MYGGRNDEDGAFSDVDCYDTSEEVGVAQFECCGSWFSLSIRFNASLDSSHEVMLGVILFKPRV